MSQTEMILGHLQAHGTITPIEAMESYGCMRLGARIWDLRKAGHTIIREDETGKNRYGQPVRYARYRMGGVSGK